jgi:hypothetical protein
MKLETKAALRDRQTKIDRHVSNLGQASAKRYLERNPRPVNYRSEVLAGVFFILTMIGILIIGLAL